LKIFSRSARSSGASVAVGVSGGAVGGGVAVGVCVAVGAGVVVGGGVALGGALVGISVATAVGAGVATCASCAGMRRASGLQPANTAMLRSQPSLLERNERSRMVCLAHDDSGRSMIPQGPRIERGSCRKTATILYLPPSILIPDRRYINRSS
jgi:hypothetical protein